MSAATTAPPAANDPVPRRQTYQDEIRGLSWEEVERLTRLLPVEDGEPMDSNWHSAAIALLIESLSYFWRDRNDFFVGGNMFLHYSLRRRKDEDFKGPDFFYVDRAKDRRRPRQAWYPWEENNRYPNVVLEHLSHSTRNYDLSGKKAVYEKTLRIPEYFCYDPEESRLLGWRLVGDAYVPIEPVERGWLWSEQLQLWIGNWTGEFQGLTGTWPRFYDAQGNLVLLEGEGERQRADAERQRADAERQRAETERMCRGGAPAGCCGASAR